MRKSNTKTPLVFYVSLALLCFVLVTSHLTSGLYARYTATGAGSDSARVAKFEIGETFTEQSEVIEVGALKPNGRFERSIEITNSSEVLVSCVVTAENITGNLPLVHEPVTVDLAPGQTEHIPLEIEWETDNFSSKHAGMVDLVRVTLLAEQAD